MGRHFFRSCIDFGRAEAPVSAELSHSGVEGGIFACGMFLPQQYVFIVFFAPLVNNEIGLSLFSMLPIHIFTQ